MTCPFLRTIRLELYTTWSKPLPPTLVGTSLEKHDNMTYLCAEAAIVSSIRSYNISILGVVLTCVSGLLHSGCLSESDDRNLYSRRAPAIPLM